MKTVVCQSQSEGVTKALGRKLGENLSMAGIILLEGELGAGKTTFIQGLAEGLGISEAITSPTFTIMNVFPNTTHSIIKTFIHIDLYRISSEDSIEDIDVDQYINDPSALVVVEWPERIPGLWKDSIGKISLETKELHHRSIIFSGSIASLMS
ncbi:MAG: tRNA (adenosine(37)-N6)-threonylcarbamoyltransferase complex ATPase subunit type 1 TsaE [bacterium]|nr:tRNA (adenosine(37)-N6)-threonylcarbamoyltransferase complex ATPase subunit type 1 TsaE [bacterium]